MSDTELFPFLPFPFHQPVRRLPINTRMGSALLFHREISAHEVTWFQCDICGAQRPLPQVVVTVVDVPPPRRSNVVPSLHQRISHPSKAMKLMEHGDSEHSLFIS